MTATEVLTALEWQAARVARLETEAKPAHWLAEPNRIDGVALDTARQAVTTLRSLAAEQERLIELLQLVGAAMPQWRRDSDRQLSAAGAAVLATVTREHSSRRPLAPCRGT